MTDSESPQKTEELAERRDDEPLTSDEVRQAAIDLYTHAKDVWLRPVRKEVRSWLRAGKGFLDGLGRDAGDKN